MNNQILIIEDEFLIQQSLKTLLESKGFEVTVTALGKEAIHIMLKREFRRIVCDLMLQDISGFDILEESKKKYSAEEIKEKFVIMTAYSSPQIIDRVNTYGCPFLAKPFERLEDALAVMTK